MSLWSTDTGSRTINSEPLTRFISPGEPLPISWVASVVAQICTVLSYAHAIPVVHRDLKPDNVMVATDGTVKVLDFGIAAILRPDATRLTEAGVPMGTARYMSPEQVQAVQVTPRTDLHELCAGEPVFDGGENGARLIARTSSGDPGLQPWGGNGERGRAVKARAVR